MTSYCDLHTHLIPGVDDGPGAMECSLEAARQLVELGFDTAVATPHRPTSIIRVDREAITSSHSAMREALDSGGIRLDVRLGTEYMFGPDLFEDVSAGKLITLGGSRYFLVEFKSFSVQEFNKQFFFKMRIAGFIPVIAHPERNELRTPQARDFFNYMISVGAVLQCDIFSLIGRWGRHAREMVLTLLENQTAAVISTDTHCRKQDIEELPKAMDALRASVGRAGVELLLGENPRAILQGKATRKLDPK